jgi:hypothetical protein
MKFEREVEREREREREEKSCFLGGKKENGILFQSFHTSR